MGWDVLRSDVRLALRRLLATPGFAAIAIASIALGVGANAAVTSAVQRILFAALPYPHPERVVLVSDRAADGSPLLVTYGSYREIAARSRSFERLAVADRWRPALTASGEPEQLTGDRVTADYFRTLGVEPAFGRNFDAADDEPGAPPVAIVSASLAKRRFGGEDAVLNRPITLDAGVYTVIGVLPERFENALAPAGEVWTPLGFRDAAPLDGPEWGHRLRMIGRLGAGVTIERARAELDGIGRAPSADFPRPSWAALGNGLLVQGLREATTSTVRPALLALWGAVGLLLVIACVNVSNLLLARALGRRAELAVRSALGAGRGRVLRELVTESLLLVALGGVAGLGVAFGVARALLALAPPSVARAGSFGLDARMFVGSLAVGAAVALAVGVLPAVRGVHENVFAGVLSASRATEGRHHYLRRGLVVAQVTLAFVLLAATGLLVRSVERLSAIAPGFDATRVLTLQVVATGRRYGSPEEVARVFTGALDAVRALPGVVDAAFTSQLPLSGEDDQYGVVFESEQRADGRGAGAAARYVVTPSWFATMKIPLLQGRLFDSSDRPGAPGAVLVSESLAKRRFGDASPVGQRVRMGPSIGRADAEWATVVGVVGDVKQTSLASESADAFYVPLGQWPWVDVVQSLAVRTRNDPWALVPDVKRAIWSIDPTPPLVRVAAMSELVERSEAQRSFALTVFGAFGVAAVALALVGLYGVLSGSVEERRREIGVRAALGASPARVAALVVRQGMALAGLGIALGAAGATAVTRGLASLLFGVTPLDAWTYAGAAALLAGMALLACAVPAARAARVDPTIALRAI